MKINKRFIYESVIFSGIIYLIAFSWILIKGYILTANYVPDIINSYASVDYLDSKVAIGYAYRYDWTTIIIGFLMLCGSYYGVRILLNHLLRKK